VIGVFKERIATFGQSEIARESLIVPFGLLKSYSGTDTVKVLYAQAPRPEAVPALTRRVEDVLRSRHRAGSLYNVQNLRAILEAARNISLAVSAVLLGLPERQRTLRRTIDWSSLDFTTASGVLPAGIAVYVQREPNGVSKEQLLLEQEQGANRIPALCVPSS
jgi:hypothetical protein